MDPLTWAAIASAVISAVGAGVGAKAQSDAADYNAKVQENKAEEEALVSRENLRRQRKENEAFMSRQRARRAKSGVGIEAGSSLLVAAESAMRLEMEALENARQSAGRQDALLQGAAFDRASGNAAMTAGYFQAGESLIRGAGSAYSAQSSSSKINTPSNSNGLAFSAYNVNSIA